MRVEFSGVPPWIRCEHDKAIRSWIGSGKHGPEVLRVPLWPPPPVPIPSLVEVSNTSIPVASLRWREDRRGVVIVEPASEDCARLMAEWAMRRAAHEAGVA